MSPSEPTDDYYSTTEVAELLDVAVRTVQLWVERGVLNAWKTPGGHRRIDAASVRKLLDERQRATAGSASRIVIVEDQPEQAELLRLCVAAVIPSAEIQVVRNGVAAMLAIGREPPGLLLLDLLMPQMDGFEVLRELSRDRDLKQMRIVVVSALSDEDIGNRGGLPDCVAGVLNKPIDFNQLKHTLQKVLNLEVGAAAVAS